MVDRNKSDATQSTLGWGPKPFVLTPKAYPKNTNKYNKNQQNQTILCASLNNLPILKFILENLNFNILNNLVTDKNNILLHASKFKHTNVECFEFLRDYFDIEDMIVLRRTEQLKNGSLSTILDFAHENKNTEIKMTPAHDPKQRE